LSVTILFEGVIQQRAFYLQLNNNKQTKTKTNKGFTS